MAMKQAVNGWVNGFIGVAIFAGSLPATRVAIADFPPIFLTSARATIAAVLGLIFLLVLRQPRPTRAHLNSLMMSALGVVIGFPLFTALALQHMTASRSIVFVGLLPICTAIFAVLRSGERPRAPFWVFSILGASFVAGYAAIGSTGTAGLGDLFMLIAILLCGLGYAEGAKLSRSLGGWQVISWALLLSLPVMLPLTFLSMPNAFSHVSIAAWGGLAYVSIFSMLLGFVFWYRGLAIGGIATVGQLQLLQPFIGLALASLLLHEQVSGMMLLVTLAALLCVAGARKYA